MAETTPQLKRKRESVVGSQKKAKKLRKSDEGAGQDDAPVAGAAKEVLATPTPVKKGKQEAQKDEGPSEGSATINTPKSSAESKNLPKAVAASDALDTPSHTASKKKLEKKESKAKAQEPVDTTATPTEQPTPAKSKPHNGAAEQSHKKSSKQERAGKESLKNKGGPTDTVAAEATPFTPAQSKSSKKKRNKEKKAESTALALQSSSATKHKKHKSKSRVTWSASPGYGGWFLPKDPVFSSDEKHIIVANPKAIHIYFAETSLLARALPITSADTFVTAFALSATKPNQLYVADSSQLITLWNWVEGTKVGRWQVGSVVKNMVVIARPGSDEDLVYCHEGGDSQIINVHALRTKEQSSATELKQVLKQKSRIQRLQVLLQGKYVVITCARSVIIGKRVRASRTAVQDFEYAWREFEFSQHITTCDAYYRQPVVPEGVKKPADLQRDIIDLAVGDESGVIFLFENILASFAASERFFKDQNATESADAFRPKRLHWHRTAVGSVKWSLDGNYLISGGGETVLTLWQLATGKPQHLPHLTAAIENVVVSPSGSSYALTLANNSVVVLSTTELDAKTNIVGIQSRRLDKKHLKTSKELPLALHAMEAVPLAVDPKNPQQILLTVPASQSRQGNPSVQPSPYLQTFDVANQYPVSRQALTRNNATDMNQTPDGKAILEPNVRLVQISHDGQYLATVDEWIPPLEDLNYIDEGENKALKEERLRRREVYLKIWRWDDSKGQWGLETRIDGPHFLEDAFSNERVLDLVANPKEHGFATIGDDHVVRIWKPTTTTHHGAVFRGANEKYSVNWTLHRLIKLPDPSKLWLSDAGATQSRARNLRLAYSADGSILAAGLSGASDADRGLIHLIDTNTATIRRSMTEIDTTVLCGLGIVGRHLVAITDCITVWDMVYDALVYCAPIATAGFSPVERMSVVRLAVNEADGTFAVSLPQLEEYEDQRSDVKRASSKMLVYDTEKDNPLFSSKIAGITLGLAARRGNGERGYIALDSVSCFRIISPGARGVVRPALESADLDVQAIEDVVEEDVDDSAGRRLELENVVLGDEHDKPVVTQQNLEEIFHNESAPQAPKDVFSAVLGLFGGVASAAA